MIFETTNFRQNLLAFRLKKQWEYFPQIKISMMLPNRARNKNRRVFTFNMKSAIWRLFRFVSVFSVSVSPEISILARWLLTAIAPNSFSTSLHICSSNDAHSKSVPLYTQALKSKLIYLIKFLSSLYSSRQKLIKNHWDGSNRLKINFASGCTKDRKAS